MQVNTFVQGMLSLGTASAGQGAAQGVSPEDAARQFEDMLVEQSQQNRQDQPAAKKDNTADKADKKQPQQAQSDKQETTEEGQEVAAALVTSQPVVLFDVVDAQNMEQTAPVQVVDPMAGMAEEVPVVQEAIAPVQEQTAQPVVEQPVGEVSVEAGFQEELQQVPVVEDQPEAQEVQVEVKPQEQAVEQVRVEKSEAPEEEQTEDTQVKDVEIEARPVFHEETATPVKVGETYEPVAPEEPEAPQQLADRLVQMLDQGETRVQIALTPENLGSMTIEITRMQDGALHVVLGAVSQKATALLQQNSANLHSLLAAGNRGEVRIEVQQQEPQEQMNQFLNPDEQGKQQPQQQHKPQQQAETEDFIQQLRLGLVEKDEE